MSLARASALGANLVVALLLARCGGKAELEADAFDGTGNGAGDGSSTTAGAQASGGSGASAASGPASATATGGATGSGATHGSTATGGGTATGGNAGCMAPGDGARFGYHTPEPGDTWLYDCENPLSREYWRVFVRPDGAAYMMPRPVGWESWSGFCQSDGGELFDVVWQNGLCDGTFDQHVDALDPSDALALARALHAELVFVAIDGVVDPFAIPSDVLDVCLANEALASGLLEERCQFEIEAKASGVRGEDAPELSNEQAVALADALNQLYGIDDDAGLCGRLRNLASRRVFDAVGSAGTACSDAVECTSVSVNTWCFKSCGAEVAASAEEQILAVRAAVDDTVCRASEAAGCPEAPLPPCID